MSVSKRSVLSAAGVVALLLVGALLFFTPFAMANYWGRQGDRAIQCRQLDFADECFRNASSWLTGDGEFTLKRARIARLQGDTNRTQELIEKAGDEGASRAKCRRESFLLTTQGGRAPQLMDDLPQQVAAAGDDAPAVLHAYAVGLLAAGQPDAALEVLDQWLVGQPEAPIAYLQKGLIFFDLGKNELAEKALADALRREPDLLDANLAMGRVKYRLQKDDEALNFFQYTIRLDPQNLEARLSAAGLLLSFRQTEKALDLFESILQEQPNNYAVRLNLATIYTTDQPMKVIELIEPLISEFQDEVSLTYLLATAYDQLGQHEKAEEYLQRHLNGRAELDRLLELERQAEYGKVDSDTRKELGLGFLKYDWESAGPWLTEALSDDPASPDLHAAMARLARKQGEPKMARQFDQAAEALRKRALNTEAQTL